MFEMHHCTFDEMSALEIFVASCNYSNPIPLLVEDFSKLVAIDTLNFLAQKIMIYMNLTAKYETLSSTEIPRRNG